MACFANINNPLSYRKWCTISEKKINKVYNILWFFLHQKVLTRISNSCINYGSYWMFQIIRHDKRDLCQSSILAVTFEWDLMDLFQSSILAVTFVSDLMRYKMQSLRICSLCYPAADFADKSLISHKIAQNSPNAPNNPKQV